MSNRFDFLLVDFLYFIFNCPYTVSSKNLTFIYLNKMCASTSKVQKDQTNSTLSENDLIDESVLRLLDEPFDTGINNSKLRNDVKHRGFDPSTGNSWIYPTNYPVRTYQFNITRACLFKNTLVSFDSTK